MNKDQIFTIWAPDASLWSTWTKPVLFAHLDTIPPGPPLLEVPPVNLNWCPPIGEKVVVIVDLPGVESVWTGLSLADLGYRPVPLYNAIPLPGNHPPLDPMTQRRIAAVDVSPIVDALRNGTERLVALQIPADAPPAFLLDANRQGDGRIMIADDFDNRSVCFTTDFPSANFLLAHDFQRALLVQKSQLIVPSDLSYVLHRWQKGGIRLEVMRLDSAAFPEPLEIARPSWFGAMFQRVLLALGLRRASAGGFGAWIPEEGGGGGG
jgi:hypothetical protein